MRRGFSHKKSRGHFRVPRLVFSIIPYGRTAVPRRTTRSTPTETATSTRHVIVLYLFNVKLGYSLSKSVVVVKEILFSTTVLQINIIRTSLRFLRQLWKTRGMDYKTSPRLLKLHKVVEVTFQCLIGFSL